MDIIKNKFLILIQTLDSKLNEVEEISKARKLNPQIKFQKLTIILSAVFSSFALIASIISLICD